MFGSVVGDNLGQHPGWQGGTGQFFIGVFGGLIDTADPSTSVYLWETSGGNNTVRFDGPQIQLGYWDGTAFTPYGVPQIASYLGTGVLVFDGIQIREITSSITPLSAFGVTSGFLQLLNAVEISANPTGHDQVTAVATDADTPEPAVVLTFAGGLMLLIAFRRVVAQSNR
jgi:hypothetical protein